ncbi:glycoside hydrolase family 3 N-terminal domain-containing protein [Modestobacter sp. VKM Ac-2978]|uniref:beta-xylosidase/alpha-l-arabinosidase n=1 Tax=Modestobacter sp. VKM Ac-2978 TaxID=3004132 RepID=UPI0022AA6306|nr:glycoside hydrolase family 3 N-terminal domain-containing protein [Modestobacter sp. VKM Ac-2978]MCZ2849694.1 glycoside hydrolase family 3 C-terminal domain-containing protein [Modestobacter sp. VKM Ac-2978]
MIEPQSLPVPDLETPSLAPWQDPSRPLPARVRALMEEMTLEEKVAQLYGVWTAISEGEEVAPNQHEFSEPLPPWEELTRPGLGQLTRVFGTGPVEPATGAKVLAQTQRGIVDGSRLGIPAIAHEECLTGFTAWGATVFPTPLAWGASFDAATVEAMSAGIGDLMRSVGVHQGLSPVLDVSFDHRWGRTEETIGEDPYLVAVLGSAYTRGLESTGIVATLKHFAGYSASGAGRNHAPVTMGPREFADVVLPPFETALREGGARSVMNSYAAVDGVPAGADPALLTDLLRDQLGFDGVVVADYFAVSMLETTQGVAGSPAEAAALALTAGIDVELPTVRCYGEPLLDLVRTGALSMEVIDRALERVLLQKGQLGLLDAGWDPEPSALRDGGEIDFDPPHMRALARTLAERSVVLLADRAQVLPLQSPASVAVVGPCADDVLALMGCYAFPNHVGVAHPDMPLGIDLPTLLDQVRAEFPTAEVTSALGCPVQEPDTSGIAEAVRAAEGADVCLAVLGDRAGLFGRGTSGEGCDADDLRLPGSQAQLLEALLDTGKPVVVVLLTGRPYALGDVVDRAAAIVQAFFPGEEGAGAVAGVLSGRVNPSGRLPVQVARTPGGSPATYLHAALGAKSGISAADPTPCFPFGHGLSYTSFDWSQLEVDGAEPGEAPGAWPTDGEVTVSCTVRNTGERAGADVVQLYLHDPVASVTRPVRQLVGFARVELAAGAAARVTFTVHADRASFTGRDLRRVVESGDVVLQLGASSEDLRLAARLQLTGPDRVVGADRVLTTPVEITQL